MHHYFTIPIILFYRINYSKSYNESEINSKIYNDDDTIYEIEDNTWTNITFVLIPTAFESTSTPTNQPLHSTQRYVVYINGECGDNFNKYVYWIISEFGLCLASTF